MKSAVEYIGVTECDIKLIDYGCDGTKCQYWTAQWTEGSYEGSCTMGSSFLAHCLELSLKDAPKEPAIDELLLQVYYVYKNSPKKCHELEVVIEELKACLEPTGLLTLGETQPLRACGTLFIAHNVAGLGRLIDRFGAYLAVLRVIQESINNPQKFSPPISFRYTVLCASCFKRMNCVYSA